jgi:hypothetical protein
LVHPKLRAQCLPNRCCQHLPRPLIFISGWPAPLTRRDGTLHDAAEFFVHRNQLLARPLARNLVADLSGNDVLPTCNIARPNNGPLSQFCTMCPKQGID